MAGPGWKSTCQISCRSVADRGARSPSGVSGPGSRSGCASPTRWKLWNVESSSTSTAYSPAGNSRLVELDSVRIEQLDREVVVDVSRQDGKRRRAGSPHGTGTAPTSAQTSAASAKRTMMSPHQLPSPSPEGIPLSRYAKGCKRGFSGQERPTPCLTSMREGSRHRSGYGCMRIRHRPRKRRAGTGPRLRVVEDRRVRPPRGCA